jgi:hypothetical protein
VRRPLGHKASGAECRREGNSAAAVQQRTDTQRRRTKQAQGRHTQHRTYGDCNRTPLVRSPGDRLLTLGLPVPILVCPASQACSLCCSPHCSTHPRQPHQQPWFVAHSTASSQERAIPLARSPPARPWLCLPAAEPSPASLGQSDSLGRAHGRCLAGMYGVLLMLFMVLHVSAWRMCILSLRVPLLLPWSTAPCLLTRVCSAAPVSCLRCCHSPTSVHSTVLLQYRWLCIPCCRLFPLVCSSIRRCVGCCVVAAVAASWLADCRRRLRRHI